MKKGKYLKRSKPGWKILAAVFAALFLLAGYKRIAIGVQRGQNKSYTTQLASRAVMVQQATPQQAKPQTPDHLETLTSETQGPAASQETAAPGQEAPAEPVVQEEPAPIQVNFAYLRQQIPNIRGWVYCPDTPINYPVVQGRDNQYYVNHMADGTGNAAGAIFLDYRNGADLSDRITVVYGHNMLDGSMFASVRKYNDQAYYDQHPVWYWLTPDKSYRVELLAGYVAPAKSAIYGIVTSEAERNALLAQAVEASRFQSAVTEPGAGPLIAFSTCTYEYEDSRFILLGKLVEIPSLGEEI